MGGQESLKETIQGLSFEDAMKRLEEVVELLERGEVDLEDALNLYQEGTLLARHCDQKLTQIEQKIQLLIEEDGKFVTQDFNAEGE